MSPGHRRPIKSLSNGTIKAFDEGHGVLWLEAPKRSSETALRTLILKMLNKTRRPRTEKLNPKALNPFKQAA